MGIIEEKLRKFQDNQRDVGWRIKWIPWQEPGKPEYVYNTSLTTALAFCGMAMFIVSLLRIMKTQNPSRELIVIAVIGFIILLLSRFLAARLKQKDWVDVKAVCIDREIQGGLANLGKKRSDIIHVFGFRLLCSFEYIGKKYTVTPEFSEVTSFNSADDTNQYLNERIGSDGSCILWIDPKNPLHAVFHKKQIISS